MGIAASHAGTSDPTDRPRGRYENSDFRECVEYASHGGFTKVVTVNSRKITQEIYTIMRSLMQFIFYFRLSSYLLIGSGFWLCWLPRIMVCFQPLFLRLSLRLAGRSIVEHGIFRFHLFSGTTSSDGLFALVSLADVLFGDEWALLDW